MLRVSCPNVYSVSSVENHIKLLSSEIERHHPQRRYWGGFGSAFLLFTTTEPLSIHELCIFGMCIKVNTDVEIQVIVLLYRAHLE